MTKRRCCLILIVLLSAAALFGCSTVHVDNYIPAADLIQSNYNQEQFFTIQAIYRVQRSFHPVSAEYLCNYEGITLECKREIENGYDYYVLLDNTVRCFIFVDENDNVANILVVYHFPSVEDIQLRSGNENQYTFFPTVDDTRSSIDLGTSEVGVATSVYFCSDGVVVVTDQNGETPILDAYTDDAWEDIYTEYGGYRILPIDKG